jgi:hypothetical protein
MHRLNGSFLGIDDQGFLKEEVKAYVNDTNKVASEPLKSPIFPSPHL